MQASPAGSASTATSYKDIQITDFNTTSQGEDSFTLTPPGIDRCNSSGKNFFELINIQNKSTKNQQIKQKKPLNLPINTAKSAAYTDIVIHCINVSV